MSVKNYLLAFVWLFAFSQHALANIEVSFTESAPKDRFSIKNVGTCDLSQLIVNIDLTQSDGRLIFDTTAVGAGVEVFQPFEVSTGSLALHTATAVQDGDTELTVKIDSIQANETVSFTIDVDDTLPKSELGMIRVTGSEMNNGAVGVVIGANAVKTAAFGPNNKAVVLLSPCS